MKHLIRLVVALMLAVGFGPLQAQAFSGGFVDGVMTLTKANSPYTLTQTIQISRGSTLKVEPGVVLKIKHDEVVFKSAGSLELLGTAEAKIQIDGAVALFETDGNWQYKATFKATFVEAIGIGSVFTALSQGQNIYLSDNIFLGNPSRSKAIYNYISDCSNCSFERNVFKGLPAFRFVNYSYDGKKVKLFNNLFVGNSTTSMTYGDYHRNGEWMVTDGHIELAGNSFIKFKKPVIQRYLGKADLVLDGNYFDGLGSVDLSKIVLRDLTGFLITFSNPLTSPDPKTPLEPAISLAPPRDFGWKFKGSTLEVKTTKLASPSDTIRVELAGKQYSTLVIANTNVVTLSFDGVTLGGNATTKLQITSRLFTNEFDINETFSSCQSMWTRFDGGIAKASTSKNKGVKNKKKPTSYPVGYAANSALDKDRDGLVCER